MIGLIGPGTEIQHTPRVSFAVPEHQTVGRQFVDRDLPPIGIDKESSEIGPITESFEGAVKLDFLTRYFFSLGASNIKKPGSQLGALRNFRWSLLPKSSRCDAAAQSEYSYEPRSCAEKSDHKCVSEAGDCMAEAYRRNSAELRRSRAIL